MTKTATRITVRLPIVEKELLEGLAEERDVPASELAREGIRRALRSAIDAEDGRGEPVGDLTLEEVEAFEERLRLRDDRRAGWIESLVADDDVQLDRQQLLALGDETLEGLAETLLDGG